MEITERRRGGITDEAICNVSLSVKSAMNILAMGLTKDLHPGSSPSPFDPLYYAGASERLADVMAQCYKDAKKQDCGTARVTFGGYGPGSSVVAHIRTVHSVPYAKATIHIAFVASYRDKY